MQPYMLGMGSGGAALAHFVLDEQQGNKCNLALLCWTSGTDEQHGCLCELAVPGEQQGLICDLTLLCWMSSKDEQQGRNFYSPYMFH
eukprot:scaffold153076_cov17-Tisochrysis_lutea.AAC.1